MALHTANGNHGDWMIDHILFNATIFNSTHTALAIIGEKIVATGNDDEIKRLAGANTTIENLNGQFVMPGFVDAHLHWENTAKYRHAVQLFEVPSKAEALERVRAQVSKLKRGDWIFGSGWTQAIWEDGAFPTAADLDSVTGDVPAYLVTKSGHAAWVNSAALRIAGIDDSTPDPAGGKIGRNETHGILFETAMNLVKNHMPSITLDRVADWMVEVQEEAWSLGIIGVHDFDNPSCMVVLQMLRERGQLGVRVVKQINDPFIEHAYEVGLRSGFGDDWIRIGALKIFADGALGPRTAAMIEPYEGEPDNYGVVVTDKEEIYALVSKASKMGFASTVHAIGDKAVHDVLDVFEAVRREESESGIKRKERLHRIEHVQIIHPGDVNRLAQLDVIASMQPIHATSDMQMADRHWGARAKYSYQWQLQKQAGAVLAFGSDSPIDPYHPFKGILAAVARPKSDGSSWYPEACVSMRDALEAYTTGAAFAAGTADHSGKLLPGYLADLIILDRNLLNIPHDEILSTRVLGTMIGGKWRYRV